MTMENLTDQELADATQKAIWRAVNLGNEATRRTCCMAANDPIVAQVVPSIAKMTGALLTAHGYATEAANLMPDVTPSFGGK